MRNSFLAKLLLISTLSLLLFCSSEEQKLMAEYEQAQSMQDGREQKMAKQLVYQKMIRKTNALSNTGREIPVELKKLAVLTTQEKLDTALARLDANPGESNTEQIGYWRADIEKFLPSLKSKEAEAKYVKFILGFF